MDLILHILFNAILLFLVGRMVDGIEVRDGKAAIFGAIVLGLANVSVRKLIVLLTLPITMVTLGLFLLVVNALMLMLAAAFVDGFEVDDFGAAMWGSVAFSVMNFLAGMLLG
jgi:putative membrane protein